MASAAVAVAFVEAFPLVVRRRLGCFCCCCVVAGYFVWLRFSGQMKNVPNMGIHEVQGMTDLKF
jgi:hypothetical protein